MLGRSITLVFTLQDITLPCSLPSYSAYYPIYDEVILSGKLRLVGEAITFARCSLDIACSSYSAIHLHVTNYIAPLISSVLRSVYYSEDCDGDLFQNITTVILYP